MIRGTRTAAILAAVAVLLLASGPAAAAALRVAFFNPFRPSDPYWAMVAESTAAAARDLDITLEVHHAYDNHLTMVRQVQQALARPLKPDVILFRSFRKNGGEILRMVDQSGAKSFLIGAALEGDLRAKVGRPRDPIKSWLGELSVDDHGLGRLLAANLYQRALDEGAVAPIEILALSGNVSDGASASQVEGLKALAGNIPDLLIRTVQAAGWTRDEGYWKTRTALTRFANVKIIWCSSDETALGAADAAVELGLIAGEDVVIGGMGWTPAGLAAIDDGRLSASAGGDLLQGAMALVLLADWRDGLDFADAGGTSQVLPAEIIDAASVAERRPKLGRPNWDKVDFTALTRKKSGAKAYDLTVRRMLDLL